MQTVISKKASVQTTSPPSAVLKPVQPKPRYMPYGDAARVLGTVAVVIGHVCDMVLFNNNLPATATLTDWRVCNLVDAACRWAVPIYIMLSGALLLDPERADAPEHFYKKRLARLGVPIVFWSGFFIWFSIYVTGWSTADRAMLDLAQGKPYAHLHFIFRIAGLYAFTPMIRVFLRHASQKMVLLTVLILLGLSTLDSVINAWAGQELSAFFRFAPFLGFYLAGYLLRDRRLTKRQVWGCWALAAACVLIMAGGTELLVRFYGLKPYPSMGMMLYDFLSPVRIAFAVAVWLIFINTFDQAWLNTGLGRSVSWLAPTTLGLYLVHPFFRDILLARYGIDALWPNIWLGIPLVSAMVYVPSLAFTWFVMRIPFARRIVG